MMNFDNISLKYQRNGISPVSVRRKVMNNYILRGVLVFFFRLEMSFTKIEMERWISNQAKSSKTVPNSERKQQSPKIMSNASTSTDNDCGNAIKIRLRKHLIGFRFEFFEPIDFFGVVFIHSG